MSDRSIKSSMRTLQVLEYFAKVQTPLTVGTLAEALHVPQPSMSMLLRNIERLGYLEYDREHRTYVPTIRTSLLGSWLEKAPGNDTSLGCDIDRLHQQIGEEVYVGRQNGPFMQYIFRHGVQVLSCNSEAYKKKNLLTQTTCGQAILAMKSDKEILGWVSRCNAEAFEEYLRVRRSVFLDAIATVRGRGYSESCGNYRPGLSGIAVAFVPSSGGSPLAISVGGLSEQINSKKDAIVAALHAFVRKHQWLSGEACPPLASAA